MTILVSILAYFSVIGINKSNKTIHEVVGQLNLAKQKNDALNY